MPNTSPSTRASLDFLRRGESSSSSSSFWAQRELRRDGFGLAGCGPRGRGSVVMDSAGAGDKAGSRGAISAEETESNWSWHAGQRTSLPRWRPEAQFPSTTGTGDDLVHVRPSGACPAAAEGDDGGCQWIGVTRTAGHFLCHSLSPSRKELGKKVFCQSTTILRRARTARRVFRPANWSRAGEPAA